MCVYIYIYICIQIIHTHTHTHSLTHSHTHTHTHTHTDELTAVLDLAEDFKKKVCACSPVRLHQLYSASIAP